MPQHTEKYKLSWVNPLTATFSYSKIFYSQVDAVMFIQTLDPQFDYIMFQYKGENENGVKWELLPYGSYQSYKYGMILSQYVLDIGIVLLITYLILKK